MLNHGGDLENNMSHKNQTNLSYGGHHDGMIMYFRFDLLSPFHPLREFRN